MDKGGLPETAIAAIRDRFSYDPATGIIVHRIASARNKVGERAGSIGTNGYRFIRFQISGIRYSTCEHRIAWVLYYGSEPKHVIDHIDNNKINNRIDNLRDVTQSQNLRRAKRSKSELTRGVTRRKLQNKPDAYSVQFKRPDGGRYYSYHKSAEEAEQAFRCAFHECYGNFPEEI